eukprot:scaffold154784_cov32-Tisochrysis_lutea.AAC.1
MILVVALVERFFVVSPGCGARAGMPAHMHTAVMTRLEEQAPTVAGLIAGNFVVAGVNRLVHRMHAVTYGN